MSQAISSVIKLIQNVQREVTDLKDRVADIDDDLYIARQEIERMKKQIIDLESNSTKQKPISVE